MLSSRALLLSRSVQRLSPKGLRTHPLRRSRRALNDVVNHLQQLLLDPLLRLLDKFKIVSVPQLQAALKTLLGTSSLKIDHEVGARRLAATCSSDDARLSYSVFASSVSPAKKKIKILP